MGIATRSVSCSCWSKLLIVQSLHEGHRFFSSKAIVSSIHSVSQKNGSRFSDPFGAFFMHSTGFRLVPNPGNLASSEGLDDEGEGKN